MCISSPAAGDLHQRRQGVLVNVTGSMDIGLEEVETAANLVQQAAHPDALIIFGAAFDDTLEDEIRVTVIATGFEEAAKFPYPDAPSPPPGTKTEAPERPRGGAPDPDPAAGRGPLRRYLQDFQSPAKWEQAQRPRRDGPLLASQDQQPESAGEDKSVPWRGAFPHSWHSSVGQRCSGVLRSWGKIWRRRPRILRTRGSGRTPQGPAPAVWRRTRRRTWCPHHFAVRRRGSARVRLPSAQAGAPRRKDRRSCPLRRVHSRRRGRASRFCRLIGGALDRPLQVGEQTARELPGGAAGRTSPPGGRRGPGPARQAAARSSSWTVWLMLWAA